ncbi:MAG: 3-phosphoglycerate dehydrogenase, partial [Ruminococcus sp.]|nr:3-phosphoglycerate dehydrogenase [Ruminococcus sp.]
ANIDDIFTNRDYVTVHVPLMDATRDLIDADAIAKMKDGVRILNYSRDGLVNAQAVLDAIKSGKVAKYVTDFSTDEVLAEDGVICLPHLGASTPESEDNCAVMAADQVKEYIENGNIVNSVNYPNVTMAKSGEVRYCVLFKTGEDAVKNITSAVKGLKAVEAKTRGAYGYAIADANDDGSVAALEALDEVIKVRVIK